MPRPATAFQKKVVRRWLNETASKIQGGDTEAINQIYNVIMFTDQELLAAINAYVANFVATHYSNIDNLNNILAAEQAAIDELEAGNGS